MFDVEEFIADCRTALGESSPQSAVREVVELVMSRPSEVEQVLGTPQRAEIAALHHSPELTILKVIWAPGMSIYPHDHRMWAVIGLYGGVEENVFYRRSPQGLERTGGKRLATKDATLLGKTIIHGVTNPLGTLTGAIHVYGGDFFTTPRSGWDPQTLEERPYDVQRAAQLFAQANERLHR